MAVPARPKASLNLEIGAKLHVTKTVVAVMEPFVVREKIAGPELILLRRDKKKGEVVVAIASETSTERLLYSWSCCK
jgi:hypothetical protein